MTVTDPVTVVLEETRKEVLRRKNTQSWRKLAAELGLSKHGLVHAVGTGRWQHVAWDSVRLIRQRLGLPDPGELIFTLPPLGRHHKARAACWRPYCSLATRELVEAQRRPGETDDQCLRRLITPSQSPVTLGQED